jgi:hypothetical protein
MRVAIIYFGMSRAARHTRSSINLHILQPLQNAGVKVASIASLNISDSIHSSRSGAFHVAVENGDDFTIEARHYVLVRQDDESIAAEMNCARTQTDPFENDYVSVKNLLHQLASLKRGWRALHAFEPGKFDYYYFIRPDLRYEDRIDLEDLKHRLVSPESILLPSWHGWGGLNDRFAVARPEAAEHYALRIDLVAEFCRSNPLHSETFLAWALAKRGCSIAELPARASRIRGNGAMVREDFSATRVALPRQAERFTFPPVEFVGGADASPRDLVEARAGVRTQGRSTQ